MGRINKMEKYQLRKIMQILCSLRQSFRTVSARISLTLTYTPTHKCRKMSARSHTYLLTVLLKGMQQVCGEILQYSLHFYIVSTCYFYDLQISVKEKQL